MLSTPVGLSFEELHPDAVGHVGRDHDAPPIEAVIRLQLALRMAFNPRTRLVEVGDFDTDGNDGAIVVIGKELVQRAILS
jgi:hypothetical protein